MPYVPPEKMQQPSMQLHPQANPMAPSPQAQPGAPATAGGVQQVAQQQPQQPAPQPAAPPPVSQAVPGVQPFRLSGNPFAPQLAQQVPSTLQMMSGMSPKVGSFYKRYPGEVSALKRQAQKRKKMKHKRADAETQDADMAAQEQDTDASGGASLPKSANVPDMGECGSGGEQSEPGRNTQNIAISRAEITERAKLAFAKRRKNAAKSGVLKLFGMERSGGGLGSKKPRIAPKWYREGEEAFLDKNEMYYTGRRSTRNGQTNFKQANWRALALRYLNPGKLQQSHRIFNKLYGAGKFNELQHGYAAAKTMPAMSRLQKMFRSGLTPPESIPPRNVYPGVLPRFSPTGPATAAVESRAYMSGGQLNGMTTRGVKLGTKQANIFRAVRGLAKIPQQVRGPGAVFGDEGLTASSDMIKRLLRTWGRHGDPERISPSLNAWQNNKMHPTGLRARNLMEDFFRPNHQSYYYDRGPDQSLIPSVIQKLIGSNQTSDEIGAGMGKALSNRSGGAFHSVFDRNIKQANELASLAGYGAGLGALGGGAFGAATAPKGRRMSGAVRGAAGGALGLLGGGAGILAGSGIGSMLESSHPRLAALMPLLTGFTGWYGGSRLGSNMAGKLVDGHNEEEDELYGTKYSNDRSLDKRANIGRLLRTGLRKLRTPKPSIDLMSGFAPAYGALSGVMMGSGDSTSGYATDALIGGAAGHMGHLLGRKGGLRAARWLSKPNLVDPHIINYAKGSKIPTSFGRYQPTPEIFRHISRILGRSVGAGAGTAAGIVGGGAAVRAIDKSGAYKEAVIPQLIGAGLRGAGLLSRGIGGAMRGAGAVGRGVGNVIHGAGSLTGAVGRGFSGAGKAMGNYGKMLQQPAGALPRAAAPARGLPRKLPGAQQLQAAPAMQPKIGLPQVTRPKPSPWANPAQEREILARARPHGPNNTTVGGQANMGTPGQYAPTQAWTPSSITPKPVSQSTIQATPAPAPVGRGMPTQPMTGEPTMQAAGFDSSTWVPTEAELANFFKHNPPGLAKARAQSGFAPMAQAGIQGLEEIMGKQGELNLDTFAQAFLEKCAEKKMNMQQFGRALKKASAIHPDVAESLEPLTKEAWGGAVAKGLAWGASKIPGVARMIPGATAASRKAYSMGRAGTNVAGNAAKLSPGSMMANSVGLGAHYGAKPFQAIGKAYGKLPSGLRQSIRGGLTGGMQGYGVDAVGEMTGLYDTGGMGGTLGTIGGMAFRNPMVSKLLGRAGMGRFAGNARKFFTGGGGLAGANPQLAGTTAGKIQKGLGIAGIGGTVVGARDAMFGGVADRYMAEKAQQAGFDSPEQMMTIANALNSGDYGTVLKHYWGRMPSEQQMMLMGGAGLLGGGLLAGATGHGGIGAGMGLAGAGLLGGGIMGNRMGLFNQEGTGAIQGYLPQQQPQSPVDSLAPNAQHGGGLSSTSYNRPNELLMQTA